MNYEIWNYKDKVVVAAKSVYQNSSSYFLYALQLNVTSASNIAMFNVSGVKELNRLADVVVSPKLTKIAIVYENMNGVRNVVTKHIGSSSSDVLDLQFGTLKSQFLETTNGVNKTK